MKSDYCIQVLCSLIRIYIKSKMKFSFTGSCLKKMLLLQASVLKLLPQCLAAAHDVLGVHPFPRLDVLIVSAEFSSLGMARYLTFLSLI